MTALSPGEAIAVAAARLEERGFAVVARNERGDSLYLAPAGSRFRLRVSNHRRTPKQRRNHAEVLASLVIRSPCSLARLQDMVDAAMRDFAAALTRRQSAAAASPG